MVKPEISASGTYSFPVQSWRRASYAAGRMQGDRKFMSDRAVRSVLVIVPTLGLPLVPRTWEAYEPVPAQAFGPLLAAERFYDAVARA